MESKNFSKKTVQALTSLDFYNPETDVFALAEYLGQITLSKEANVRQRQLIIIAFMLRDIILNAENGEYTFENGMIDVQPFSESNLEYLNLCLESSLNMARPLVIPKPTLSKEGRSFKIYGEYHKGCNILLKNKYPDYWNKKTRMLIFGTTGELIFNIC